MLDVRDGYDNVLPGEAVALSILLATFQRFVRYLNKDRRDDTKNGAAEQPTAPRRPQRLTRHFWDDVPDDPTHPCFDAALSQMLPGEKIYFGDASVVTNAWKRVRNGRFSFGRFFEFDLSLQKDRDGRTMRAKHFELRLWRCLPWVKVPVCDQVFSPYPARIALCTSSPLLDEVLQEAPLFDVLRGSEPVPEFAKQFSIFSLSPAVLQNQDRLDNEVESICMQLEKAFTAEAACACCASPLDLRCHWCTNACGWHRCQKLQIGVAEGSLSDPSAVRWRPSTLHVGSSHGRVRLCVAHA